ncbi:hypothetical protein ONZ45_g16452 [Pleurotus djamor]|nr:hypothetical protein ONZ45_g16452 [Pleurotus djamor]
MFNLPSSFCLPDLTAITAPVFVLKKNPYQVQANIKSEAWLSSFKLYDDKKLKRFLGHRFDVYGGLAFPDTDPSHLETCINFFFWAFSLDDISDEGELQSMPEHHQAKVDVTLSVLKAPPSAHVPGLPYAAMLHDLWRRLTATATPGACRRFARAAEGWCRSQVWQCANRATGEIPSVDDFIVMRRHTIGAGMVEAMVEYALNIDLPDEVFKHPTIMAMSTATNDIMTWPNDLCSFNKEQADGDYQNLVYCVMVERRLKLQEAIDAVVEMLKERVQDYLRLKRSLPSFGPQVDKELVRYLAGLEHYVQGTVVWYYSPRYFRGLDISNRTNLIVPVFNNSV